MKALTIIQPYAELIAKGSKLVENREWFTPYRGQIAIHAGMGKRYDGYSVDEMCQNYGVPMSDIVFGAVIAKAKIVACLHIDAINKLGPEHDFGWVKDHSHTHGTYCWILDEIKRIEPIYIKGALGLWEWDGSGNPTAPTQTPKPVKAPVSKPVEQQAIIESEYLFGGKP
jgi:hypothetical protein